MAGRGSRLADWQENVPKPLILIAGKPMIEWALESLKGIPATEVVFVLLAEHEKLFGIKQKIKRIIDLPIKFNIINEVTEGQLCTVLTARHFIIPEEDILIASIDTLVISDLANHLRTLSDESHGLISVANMPGDKWSFARTNADGNVIEVAEKKRISDNASTGIYYFRSGREFLEMADKIIAKREKTRGEYYVIPVYQKYIERGWKVGVSKASEVWDMGNPDAIIEFEKHFKGNL